MKNLPGFSLFIGVDQTGAVAAKDGSRARPLHAALMKRSTSREWTLETGLQLPSLSEAVILELIRSQGFRPEQTALLVDCVFGLSSKITKIKGAEPVSRLWARLQTTRMSPKFGRVPAQKFFSEIIQMSKNFPRRECEKISGASSVFQTHPFQKNIQTGTYRIWKDLTSSPKRWLNFWSFETEATIIPKAPWIFEGYPSLFWRELFGVATRDLSKLRSAIEHSIIGHSMDPHIELQCESWASLRKNPDIADAAVLALGGFLLQRQKKLFEPFPGFNKRPSPDEGWIAGLSSPARTAPAGKKSPRQNALSKASASRPRPLK